VTPAQAGGPEAVAAGEPVHPGSSEHGSRRRLTGTVRRIVDALGLAIALYALYWVVAIVPAQAYRPTFLLLSLTAAYLLFPARAASRARVTAVDVAVLALAAAALLWPLIEGDAFALRAAAPTETDVWLGVGLIVAVLEAARRTSGVMLPATAGVFLVYAWAGPALDRLGLSLIGHRGYSVERIVGTLYVTLEGILGVPLDVAATYIVLFTLYGAIVERGGAGRFFLEWAMAVTRGAAGGVNPGRTVTVAGYLLGALSGSGVANTVTLGAVAWPLLRSARYPADLGGAVLAAAGIGAILAPPVMGATAFLMAEFLKVPYLDIVRMAVVPAALYYGSILVAVDADARRLGLSVTESQASGSSNVHVGTVGSVTRAGWHHFVSFAVMVGLMLRGITALSAVFWASVIAVVATFRRGSEALTPTRLAAALSAGGVGVVPIVTMTACAGIIVGVITLTGLGLKAASLIVTLAGASRVLTVLYAAVAVWVLGLAVPVTACYIIAAVIVAPALTQVGIAVPAAHMFVFYYAVLSEVSPPTALSPFAAAAITGGSPVRTTMLTWQYALPAFLVPLAFTWTDAGEALLLREPWMAVIVAAGSCALGLALLSIGLSGHWRRPATPVERALAIGGGALLVSLVPVAQVIGVGCAIAALVLQRRPRS
jgi:TRAP transporter 4TM/12TM fusion protein